jgi:hypothetical protein
MQVQYTAELFERLWARVDRNGPIPARYPDLGSCWISGASRTSAGYAVLRHGGTIVYAHRATLEQAAGPLPNGKRSLHVCDTPACVRNDSIGVHVVNGVALPRFGHLFIGTQADNMADMREKGRGSIGETHSAIMRKVAARGDNNGSRTHPERLIGRKMTPWKVRPELVKRGQDRWQARLTDDDVREIRRAYHVRESTQVQLAKRYGISQGQVSRIILRQSWHHLL